MERNVRQDRMNGLSDTRRDATRPDGKEAVSDAAIDGYWTDPRCTACDMTDKERDHSRECARELGH